MSVLFVGGVMGLVAGLRRVPVPTAAPATPRVLARLASVPRRVLVAGVVAAVAGVVVILIGVALYFTPEPGDRKKS